MNSSIRKYKIRRLQRRLDRLFRKDEDRLPKDQIEWITANKKHIPVKKGSGEGAGPVKGKNFSQAESKPISELQGEERAKETTLTPKQKKRDEDYMKAVESGDMDRARRMVEREAKKAGYRVAAYHGTPVKGIKSFDIRKIGSTTDDGLYGHGFYFSTHKPTSEQYATKEGETIPVFLKVSNPWWADSKHDKSKVAEEIGVDESALSYGTSGLSKKVVIPSGGQSSQFASHLQEHGYDSIIIQHGSNNYEIVVFNPNNIKSSHPVARDEDGNVIPLSKRFNSQSNDIRY